MLPIVDTHHHLWDLDRFRLPWLDEEDGVLQRSFLIADYFEATKGLNIVKTVYMEVDVDASQQRDEVAYIIELCRRPDNPMAAAVISGRPESAEFSSYVDALCDEPHIKGVRRILHTQPPGLCVEPQFIKNVQRLGELGLSYDICCAPSELPNAVKLVDACPETQFILDHCGNANVPAFKADQPDPGLRTQAEQWRHGISALAEQQHVVCKISGIVAGAGKGWTADDLAPAINHCLDAFGPDRVIFGGDWPVCTIAATYAQWVGGLKQIVASRSEADQKQLFHDNAVRLYGLEES